MSAAFSVFKPRVQNVHQLQQHTIEVSFEMTVNELLRQIVPYRQQGSLQFGNVGRFWRVFLIASQHCAPHMIIQRTEIWWIRWSFVFSNEIRAFLLDPVLFTLKNAHLSSNSYNSWTQPNIVIKFAGYVALIFLYKCCKFGEKICNNSRDIEFFLGDYFLARPVECMVCYKASLLYRQSSIPTSARPYGVHV